MERNDKITLEVLRDSFEAAIPVMLGYVAIGLPCGILSASIGMNWLQVFILSWLFYSGAGQFMIPNMFLAGADLLSVFASVSFVNTRQMLYSAALAPFCSKSRKSRLFWYMATVTDETFGISISKFKEGNWTVERAIFLNEFSHASWTVSCVVGVLLGPIFNIPLVIASFAMTSLFICLVVGSVKTKPSLLAACTAAVAVVVFKNLGLSGPAIFLGAIVGVICGYAFAQLKGDKNELAAEGEAE
ncbi:MAG: AzlC family ABC transporter permease [Phoenicibacter congonensis]|uniref:AzlC family ABC transporter permease n=1 Tax=Phoenicibacter congonensis TaxID=1944646 RepID=A0AA43UAY5_9ACTN|nr:AzlC family ABC transporter permease [Phoenicibacter congonensis]